MSAVVYTKTPKGLRESTGKTRELSSDLREVLKACNGLFTIDDIAAPASAEEKEWIAAAIAELAATGYLRDVPEAMREDEQAAPASDGMESLDFIAAAKPDPREAEEKARREAEEKARREAEEKARRDAEDKAQRDAEEKARRQAEEKHRQQEAQRRKDEERMRQAAEQKQRADAAEKQRAQQEAQRRAEEERMRSLAEEKVRAEAAEKARLEEEERARAAIRDAAGDMDEVAGKLRADFASRRGQRDEATSELIRKMEQETRLKAEEQARREAEEKARREAEERARYEAEARARRQAEEKARREAEAQARREAEERARREEEERLRREAEEKVRREAEEQARREAAEKARVEAEERARREEEERLRREAEEKVRREAEEQARREAAEKARVEAEERARREEAERIRREAEEKIRREAEEQARREAAEKARVDAEEKARRDAEEAQRRKEEELVRRIAEKRAREEAEKKARIEQEERDREAIRERILQRNAKRRRIILPAVLGLLLAVGLGLLVLHLFSFDGKRAELEKTATELFGVPVKIGSARLWVLTGPQWMIDDVAIGTDADTVKIARAKLGRSSLGTTRFDSIQLEGAQLPPAMALKLITGASGGTLLAAGDVRVTGLVFAGSQGMPPLDLQARFEGGRLTAIAGQGEDTESGKVILDMKREQQWQLNFSAAQVRWIIGPGLPLTDVTLKAEMSPGNLQVKEFAATLHGGGIGGSGNVSWQEGWRVGARLEAKLLDANKIAPAWAAEGRVSGSAALAAEAASARELLARARISGSFEIGRGLLAGMDVERVVQNSGLGEQTRFESLRGDFFSDARGIELTGLQLVAGSVKANGALTLAPDNSASGRVAIEMQSPAARRAANLRIGGTLAAPRYLR